MKKCSCEINCTDYIKSTSKKKKAINIKGIDDHYQTHYCNNRKTKSIIIITYYWLVNESVLVVF